MKLALMALVAGTLLSGLAAACAGTFNSLAATAEAAKASPAETLAAIE